MKTENISDDRFKVFINTFPKLIHYSNYDEARDVLKENKQLYRAYTVEVHYYLSKLYPHLDKDKAVLDIGMVLIDIGSKYTMRLNLKAFITVIESMIEWSKRLDENNDEEEKELIAYVKGLNDNDISYILKRLNNELYTVWNETDYDKLCKKELGII